MQNAPEFDNTLVGIAEDRLRVLMTADSLGGIWSYALHLAAALSGRNVEIHLATLGRALDEDQWLGAEAVAHLHLHESTYQLEWMDDPWADVVASGEWLQQLAKRIDPQLIHLNTYAHAALPWGAPVVVVGHSCVNSWWQAVHGARAPARYARYSAAVKAGLSAADVVVAPSRAMLTQLQNLYGPPREAQVIYNGISHTVAPAWADKEPLMLSVGRLWDEAKNVRAVVAAARSMEWPLVLAGDVQHPNGTHADLGPVRHLGLLPAHELAHWYARASVFVSPALYEPFGLSVLEAARAGCALVLGDIPSLRELWEGAALFVDPADHRGLVNVLHRLETDDAQRAKFMQRAQQRAMDFTIERCADGYYQLYRELISRSNRRLG